MSADGLPSWSVRKIAGIYKITDETVVMAIVNRTPDSFYDKGATFTDQAALDAVGMCTVFLTAPTSNDTRVRVDDLAKKKMRIHQDRD